MEVPLPMRPSNYSDSFDDLDDLELATPCVEMGSENPISQPPCKAKPSYNLSDELGSCTFARVFRAKKKGLFSKFTTKEYAVKELVYKTQEEAEQFTKDLELRKADLRLAKAKTQHPGMNQFELALLSSRTPLEGKKKQTSRKAVDFVELEEVEAELQVLEYLKRFTDGQQHIVKYIEHCFFDEGKIHKAWIITECAETDLSQMLQAFHGNLQLDLQDAGLFIHEVLLALEFLKSCRVVHCDIKPSNILLSSSGVVSLCDFGFARIIPEHKKSCTVKNVVGTPEFMASEMCTEGQEFDYSADIWSAGITLYHIYHGGESPYPRERRQQRFLDCDWDAYKAGYTSYLESMFGEGILTQEELASAPWRKSNKLENAPKITEVEAIMKDCVVPYPMHGLNNEVTRPKEEDFKPRLSLEDFLSRASKMMLDGRSNFATPDLRKQRVKYFVRKYRELKKKLVL